MEQRSYYDAGNVFREKSESNRQCFGMELVPGTKCQLQCRACYKGRKLNRSLYESGLDDTASGDVPTDRALDYIRQACEEGFREVAFLGGEPTLHRDIFTIIHEVRCLGLTPILCTNGLPFASTEKAHKLEGTGTVVVTHAYFPGGEEVIDAYSGRQGYAGISLKKAIENLRNVEGTTLVLEMPLTDDLFPHAFDFFRYCRENNIIPFIEISRPRDDRQETTHVTPEDIASLFERCRTYDQEYCPEKVPSEIHPPAYGVPCTMSITGVHVKNRGFGDYGKVYSCCAQGVCHGDLKKQSLREILTSPTLTVFERQDDYIVGPCKDCDIYQICRGGCRGTAYLKFGCPRASSPSCHRISQELRDDPAIMAPIFCDGCPLQASKACRIGEIQQPFSH